MPRKIRYMVVADGEGDYDCDFSVTWIEATSATEAAEIAISPEQGYGQRNDGTIYVVPASAVAQFSTEERSVVVLTETREAV